MSLIKEKGAPGRFTKGSVGDKYIDLDTGNEYLCTFAFGDSNGGSSEYSWRLIGTGQKPEIKMEKIPESNFQKTNPRPVEPVKEIKIPEPVKEPEPDNKPVFPNQLNRQNRNNYSKQYKPKR